MYPEFARIADEEGFPEIAATFRMVIVAEHEHEDRYLKLLSRLTDGNFFIRDHEIWWQCRNCGYICKGTEAPKICRKIEADPLLRVCFYFHSRSSSSRRVSCMNRS